MSKLPICSLSCCLALSLVGCGGGGEENTGLKPFSAVPSLENAAFYRENKSFDQAVAKKAYYDMMKAYHYPIPAYLR
ncbi:MAG: hypothetical protein ACYTFI_22860, partial [Planctomycetota bacterium]